jgi:hypothetical protein
MYNNIMSESTGIITLVSQTSANKLKYAQGNNIINIELEEKLTYLKQKSDIFKITHVIIVTFLTLVELQNSLNECNIIITICNKDFLTIPLKLLMCLNNIIISNNNDEQYINLKKYYIIFPDFLFNEIHMIGLNENDICVKFDTPTTIIKKSLLVHLIFLDSQVRKTIRENKHSRLYQKVNKLELYEDKLNKRIYKNYGDCMEKGFFIYGKSVINITNILLICNAHDILNYDKDRIMFFCKKINDNILYVPYNFEKKYYHTTVDSYIGSMNSEIVSEQLIKITVDDHNGVDNTIDLEICSIGMKYVNYDFESVADTSQYPKYNVTQKYCFEKCFEKKNDVTENICFGKFPKQK